MTKKLPSLRASNATRGNLLFTHCSEDCRALDFAKTQNLIARNDGRGVLLCEMLRFL
ncbi:hypothetical protein [Helicobacter sp. T3_23-1056]